MNDPIFLHRKMLSTFYKDHPDKPTATSFPLDTAPPMAYGQAKHKAQHRANEHKTKA